LIVIPANAGIQPLFFKKAKTLDFAFQLRG